MSFVRDGLLYASPEDERSAYSLLRAASAGEPVAYLIGEWEFYGLGLDISPAVLIPRPDTEVLVQTVVHELDSGADCRVLDLCAGSGCIGLAVASQVLRSRVLLGEWDEEALKICRQNIRRNQLSARVTSLRIDAREKPSRQLGEFDCIVSNPPYIPTADIETLDIAPCATTSRSRLTAARTDWISTASSQWRDSSCERTRPDKSAPETAMAQIESRQGPIMRRRAGRMNVEAISTGSLALDLALGIGGCPRGRIVEIYGPESSGKTTLALHILAQAQKAGGEVAFIDAEHALDPATPAPSA